MHDLGLSTLSLNLAVAGALCAAFNQRLDREYTLHSWNWRPGCGKPWRPYP